MNVPCVEVHGTALRIKFNPTAAGQNVLVTVLLDEKTYMTKVKIGDPPQDMLLAPEAEAVPAPPVETPAPPAEAPAAEAPTVGERAAETPAPSAVETTASPNPPVAIEPSAA